MMTQPYRGISSSQGFLADYLHTIISMGPFTDTKCMETHTMSFLPTSITVILPLAYTTTSRSLAYATTVLILVPSLSPVPLRTV